MKKQQQQFDLFGSDSVNDKVASVTEHHPTVSSKADLVTPKIKLFDIKQSLIGWLLQQAPTGMGVRVPTRISRYLADIAAFWSVPINKILTPRQTMIIEIRHGREACWPDCADKELLLTLLRETKNIKNELETRIQREEPELVDTNVLFEEYRDWNYHESKNSYYHEICRKVEKIEHAIYKGSRFEMIRAGQVADLLYLAVPENSVTSNEVADGWGLLYFDEHGNITEVKPAENWNCSIKKRQHLIQNIAAVNSQDMLFKNGVRCAKDCTVSFSKAPKCRRKLR
jgi:hypothetical protein